MSLTKAVLDGVIAQYPTSISYTTTAASLALALISYYYYTRVYSYFRKRGLNKGPFPFPLVGNVVALLTRDRMVLDREWSKLYGKFYGIFMGSSPRFVVNDPEVLKQICIKDFDAMPNHETSPLFNDYQKNFLFFLQDDQWKRVRALQSPTFTSGKIKRMYKLLDRCADELVLCFSEQLEDKNSKKLDKATVNVKEIYSLFTMDAITTAAYNIKLERKGTKDIKTAATRDEFVRLALRLFVPNLPKLFLALVVPHGILKFFGFHVTHISRIQCIADRIQLIIDQRRNSGRRYDDYLQLLLDARLNDRIEFDEMDDKENHHAGLTKTILQDDQDKMIKDITSDDSNGKSMSDGKNGTISPSSGSVKLTDHEILSSAILLPIVGLETTATLLTNCTYALAFHADIQQKLYETVKSIAEFNSQTGEYLFDYDTLTSCEYLDAVISETLRNLSPIFSLDRVVKRDCYIEKYGIQLKKDDKLLLAYYSIMNNPEYWPEPLKFDPERFVGDNKKKIVPGSYCPFGLGPRHCLGMRFSLTESKLALAKVLMKFKFKPAPGTSFPPQLKPRVNLSTLKTPFVELAPRNG